MTGRQIAVFGSGMAGLTAALAAREGGADVTLFEKSGAAGGSTLLSGGLLWTMPSSAEAHRRVPEGNPVLLATVCDGFAAGHAWLRGHGVRFTTDEPAPEHAHNGWDESSMSGYAFEPEAAVEQLCRRLSSLGGQLEFDTALDRLVIDNGRVIAAQIARSDGSTDQVDLDAVILATGGFQGNGRLLAQWVLPRPDDLYLRSNPWSTGDAVVAATEVGAAMSNGLHAFYGHAMVAPPARVSQRRFSELTQGYGQGCVALNLAGTRFADESIGTGEEVLNQQLARQPEARGFYLLDAKLLDRPRAPGKPVNRVAVERAAGLGGQIVTGQSLEELASLLQDRFIIPAARTLETLTNYNRGPSPSGAMADGVSRRGLWSPLTQPPFVAVPVRASITMTCGGLAVDDQMRVVRRSASSARNANCIDDPEDFREVPIPGLYAAGADVGNISSTNYIGGLATALATGRIAGRRAAAGEGLAG